MNYTIKTAEVELRGQEIFLRMTIEVVQKVDVDLNLTMNLTRRELEVLPMLRDGLANKEIAARLNISSRTVKAHVSNLLHKTHSESRHELSKRLAFTVQGNGHGHENTAPGGC